MQLTAIDARKGPGGSIAVVLTDNQGRLLSHLLRREEAEHLARDLLSLAQAPAAPAGTARHTARIP